MLNYRTLNYKPQTFLTDKLSRKTYYKDLLTKTWSEVRDDKISADNVVVVNEYYVARPDLISLAVYGNDEFGDMICKYNGVSNPFELNEGMILIIPPLQWATDGCAKREKMSCDRIKDNETIEQKDNVKKLRTEARSSSTPTVGDKPAYVIDKTLGLVFY